MTDKQIIIDVCPYQGECSVSGCKRNDDGCFVRQLFEERYKAENQIVELNKTIKAKEQECEELKEEVNSLLCSDNCYRNKKLKTCLTEIKEIAEKFYYQELGNRDCMNCDDYCFEQILQKISECYE